MSGEIDLKRLVVFILLIPFLLPLLILALIIVPRHELEETIPTAEQEREHSLW